MTDQNSSRARLWIDNRYLVEVHRHAPPPMASAQLVIRIYPITGNEAWDEPYDAFWVDEGRVLELENEIRE